MALLKWTSGDTITERSANNKGVRKGTETELACCISAADNEVGDILFNTTHGFTQTQNGGGCCDDRGNLTTGPLGANATVVSVTACTPTQRKSFSFVKDLAGYRGNQLTIVAEIKTDAGTGSFRVRKNGSCCDDLVLTTTCVAYEIKTGQIDITGLAVGRHTLEIYMDATACNTIDNREWEIYGI